MDQNKALNEDIIFEDYPYKTNKAIKISFWIILIGFIILNITGPIMIIEGIIKEDNVEIVSAIIPFIMSAMVLFPMLSFKNQRLRVYSDHISINSIFGKEKIYELNTQLMTIKINYTVSWHKGIKLTFLDRNDIKIISYILLESVTSQLTFKERRRIWGVDLKRIGCSLEDKGHYLLRESIDNKHLLNHTENDDHINDESCVYIRSLLKRNCTIIPLFYIAVSIISVGLLLWLNFLNIIDISGVIGVIIVVVLQVIPITFMVNRFKKMLRFDNEKLLEQEFSKQALEKRK